MVDFVAEVSNCDDEAAAWVLGNVLLFCSFGGAGHSGNSPTDWTAAVHRSRKTCIDRRWRSGNHLCKPTQVLRDGAERELELCSSRPA